MLLQSALKLPFFENFCPLNVKKPAEDLLIACIKYNSHSNSHDNIVIVMTMVILITIIINSNY